MKLVDVYFHGLTLEEELKRSKAKSTDELHAAFKLQCKAAKILRENTLKLKGEIAGLIVRTLFDIFVMLNPSATSISCEVIWSVHYKITGV